MYNKLYIFIVLIPLVTGINAQNLREAVNFAVDNSNTLKMQEAQLAESRLEKEAVSISMLPTIDADISYKHLTESVEMDMGKNMPPQFASFIDPMKVGAYDNYELSLMVNYVLFSGFAKTASLNIKEKHVKLQHSLFKRGKKEIALEVIKNWRRAQNFLLQKTVMDKAITRINIQQNRLASLIKQGMAIASDSLSLKLARLNYRQKSLVTVSGLETALQNLEILCGQHVEVNPFEGRSIQMVKRELIPEKDENINNIALHRSMLNESEVIARSDYYPKIALFAGAKYGKPALDIFRNEWMTYGIWGVGLKWNITRFGASSKRVEARKAAGSKVDYQKQAAIDKLRLRYQKALKEFDNLVEQENVLQEACSVANEKMKIVLSQFNQGAASVLDFNQSNLDLTEAVLKQKQQQVSILMKISEIEFISGVPYEEWSL